MGGTISCELDSNDPTGRTIAVNGSFGPIGTYEVRRTPSGPGYPKILNFEGGEDTAFSFLDKATSSDTLYTYNLWWQSANPTSCKTASLTPSDCDIFIKSSLAIADQTGHTDVSNGYHTRALCSP